MQRHVHANAAYGMVRPEGMVSLDEPHICRIVGSRLTAAEPGSTIRLGDVKLAVQQD